MSTVIKTRRTRMRVSLAIFFAERHEKPNNVNNTKPDEWINILKGASKDKQNSTLVDKSWILLNIFVEYFTPSEWCYYVIFYINDKKEVDYRTFKSDVGINSKLKPCNISELEGVEIKYCDVVFPEGHGFSLDDDDVYIPIEYTISKEDAAIFKNALLNIRIPKPNRIRHYGENALELDTNHPFGIKQNYITRSLLKKEPCKIDNNILKHFIIEKLTSILNEEEKPASVEALKDIVYRWNGIVSCFIELKSIEAPSVTFFSTFGAFHAGIIVCDTLFHVYLINNEKCEVEVKYFEPQIPREIVENRVYIPIVWYEPSESWYESFFRLFHDKDNVTKDQIEDLSSQYIRNFNGDYNRFPDLLKIFDYRPSRGWKYHILFGNCQDFTIQLMIALGLNDYNTLPEFHGFPDVFKDYLIEMISKKNTQIEISNKQMKGASEAAIVSYKLLLQKDESYTKRVREFIKVYRTLFIDHYSQFYNFEKHSSSPRYGYFPIIPSNDYLKPSCTLL
jgi:hypothetical protein